MTPQTSRTAPRAGLPGDEPASEVAAPGAEGVSEQPGAEATPTPEATEAPPAPAAAPDRAESPLKSLLSVVGTIGPPITIVTSLMIYFGWARSDRQARLMGLDVSLFGYTTQDYVLMSISTLFVPLLAVAGMGLAALALHHRVEVSLQDPSSHARLDRAGRVALMAGLLGALLAVVWAILRPEGPVASLLAPIILALGTAVAAYGAWLADAAHDPAAGAPRRSPAASQRALRALLVGTVMTLTLLWAMSTYAGIVGSGYTERLARTVSQRPHVTAISVSTLGIEAPGVTESRIATKNGEEDAIRYRTTGLRLLARSGGRMFLLHDGWSPDDGTVIVLPDNEAIRWQFSR